MQGITSSTESFDHEQLDDVRGEVRFVQTGEPFEVPEALQVNVRAYGTQRGGLGEHVEEAIENALRTLGGGAAGLEFDRDEGARLSDELFRARRLGFGGIAVRLTALRALCAPVGGLDASDARTIAFYARATVERPLVLVMDEGDMRLPAFVMSRTLEEIIDDETSKRRRRLRPRRRRCHSRRSWRSRSRRRRSRSRCRNPSRRPSPKSWPRPSRSS